MCLMLGGGMGQACEPQFPPTAECKAHKSRIQVVGLIHLCLAIAMLFMGGSGFYQLITVMCLFCATMSFNYCCVLIYIIYTFIDFVVGIDPLGLVL